MTIISDLNDLSGCDASSCTCYDKSGNIIDMSKNVWDSLCSLPMIESFSCLTSKCEYNTNFWIFIGLIIGIPVFFLIVAMIYYFANRKKTRPTTN